MVALFFYFTWYVIKIIVAMKEIGPHMENKFRDKIYVMMLLHCCELGTVLISDVEQRYVMAVFV